MRSMANSIRSYVCIKTNIFKIGFRDAQSGVTTGSKGGNSDMGQAFINWAEEIRTPDMCGHAMW